MLKYIRYCQFEECKQPRVKRRPVCEIHLKEYLSEPVERNFPIEYRAWQNMILRCSRPSMPTYKYYGGRGIKVCDAWLNSFPAFLKDVGPKPDPKLTLDREDNDGNYEPGNVRWATWKIQHANRRQKN